MSLGYFTHSSCRLHDMGTAHPESPARLDAIADRLLYSGVLDQLQQYQASCVTMGDLELAHDSNYIQSFKRLDEQLHADLLAGGPNLKAIDTDTLMNEHTWQAALHSAGAAIDATKAVLSGEIDAAFCAIRPPGHHACRGKAMGFCFFNNIALAAKYALEQGGLSRVAIIDFDVHHGNGTEDILKDDQRVLMVSFFQHPFYPFSGTENVAPNMLNVPIPAYTRGMDIRDMISYSWVPRLEAFEPEMIFISAGFDGHRLDDMGQLGLTENDYQWMTFMAKEIANKYSKGRIVSCLEGGYHLDALASSVEVHVRALADL